MMNEIEKVIYSALQNKASSPNSILYEFYKTFLLEVSKILQDILNDVLHWEKVLTSFKESMVVLLHKPNKLTDFF